jgi:hypothetical protein
VREVLDRGFLGRLFHLPGHQDRQRPYDGGRARVRRRAHNR